MLLAAPFHCAFSQEPTSPSKSECEDEIENPSENLRSYRAAEGSPSTPLPERTLSAPLPHSSQKKLCLPHKPSIQEFASKPYINTLTPEKDSPQHALWEIFIDHTKEFEALGCKFIEIENDMIYFFINNGKSCFYVGDSFNTPFIRGVTETIERTLMKSMISKQKPEDIPFLSEEYSASVQNALKVLFRKLGAKIYD